MTSKTKFLINDIVVCMKLCPGLLPNRLYTVRDVSPRGGVIKLDGIAGSFSSHRFALGARMTRPTPPVKKPVPKGVLVKTDDVMAVLTKFVREELGIDATVETVIDKYEEALMLVFKEAAA